MNVLLPLFLLLIANLALYWIFFGKAKFDRKIQEQLLAKENNALENSSKIRSEVKSEIQEKANLVDQK